MKTGKYITEHGSVVEISGKHGGISNINFDWFEEPGACCDCQVEPYPKLLKNGIYELVWHCDYCEGGSAVLIKIN